MSLEHGSRLGQYEVVGDLGAGGMGEVYRARDRELGREVALKVLPEHVAQDPERIGRLRREARILAQLNHPSVATLYGFEEADGVHFLVMELVEGETLAERLARGAMGWREAAPMFLQIADALEAAHEKGIIHRDLKPGNVKVTPEGNVKVLDFGLAIAFDVASENASRSPTLTRNATPQGVIVGTVSYMSPEQARGLAVDRRTDIWAFGCCLYETLTGERAFPGESAADILGNIVGREPDWHDLPDSLPSSFSRVLTRSLQKDPRQRLRDIGDARIELSENETSSVVQATPGPRRFGASAPALFAFLAGSIVTGFLLVRGASAPDSAEVVRLELGLPDDQTPTMYGRSVALSPDGRHVAVATYERIYVRPLDRRKATPIPRTEGARSPFYSPDGNWLGFWQNDELKKVATNNGAPIVLCRADSPYGASWTSDGRILFGQGSSGIFEVSEDGGDSRLLTAPDRGRGEVGFHGPELLPGGHLLFTVLPEGENWNGAHIVVEDLDSGERRVVVEDATDARYADTSPGGSTGHLVFARGTTLNAMAFDPETLDLRGPAVPIAERVWRSMLWETGASHFSFSRTGTLIHVPDVPSLKSVLVWVDRDGNEELLPMPERSYMHARLSPDATRVIVDTIDTQDLWLYEIERGTMSRFTTEQTHLHPIWNADGTRVVFDSSHATGLYWKRVDDVEKPELLLRDSSYSLTPVSTSSDGSLLAFERSAHHVSFDIAIVSLDDARTIRTFLADEFRQMAPMFSPDGRFIAYVSDETGQNEVYVQPFPGPGRKVLVSRAGGVEPTWARDGSELFYRSGPAMMAVSVRTQPDFSAGSPRTLFEGAYRREPVSAHPTYDVSAEGRFLMIKNVSPAEYASTIHVVLGWFEELKRLVPAGG